MRQSLKESLISARRLPEDEQVLLNRANLLGRQDRLLFTAVVLHNQPAKLVAQMLGRHPRTVQARVRRLSRHLASREFVEAARLMPTLPTDDAQLVRLRYCERASQRDICRRLGMTVHRVRRSLDRIEGQMVLCRRRPRQEPRAMAASCSGAEVAAASPSHAA